MIRSASHRCDCSPSATGTPRVASPDSLRSVSASDPARRSPLTVNASRAANAAATRQTQSPLESPTVRFLVVKLRRDGLDVASVAKATGLPRYRIRSLLKCAAAVGLLPYCHGRDPQSQIRRRRRAINAVAAASPAIDA